MGTPSWASVSPNNISADYVRNFIADHSQLRNSFDQTRSTSAEHGAALQALSALYMAAMQDGGLGQTDRQLLATLMSGTNAALLDAYYDNALAQDYGVGVDPGYYDPNLAVAQALQGTERKSPDGISPAGVNPAGVNPAGINPAGINPAGVNPAGVNPAGVNPAGINPAGINPAGVNPAGVNPAGINPAGINPAGVNPAGVNPAGINPAGVNPAGVNPAAVDNDDDLAWWQPDDATSNTGWWTSGQADGRDGFDIDMDFFDVDRADIFAGVSEDTNIRNMSGRIVADNATHVGVGAEFRGTVVDLSGNIGDGRGTGADGRLAATTNAYVGAEVQASEGTIAARGGAYVGADAEAEWSIGARYFGIGGRHTVGVGAGGEAEGHIGMEDGRFSVGGFARGGFGVTGGSGGELWIDFGQMADDASAVGNAIVDTVGGWFSGISWGRDS